MQTVGPNVGPGAFGNVGDFHGRDMDKALYAYGYVAGFLVGGYIVRPIVVGTVRSVPTLKNAWRIYKYGVGQYVAYHEMAGLLPALGPDHELAVGFGVEGTTTLGEEFESLPMGHWYALPYYYSVPIPDFGVSITSVPVYRPPLDQSREGVEDTSLYRDHDTSKSIGGPLGTPTHLLPKWDVASESRKRAPARRRSRSDSSKPPAPGRGLRNRRPPWWLSTKAKRRISRKRS